MATGSIARRRPTQTRQRLLQAAIRLFAAHGYHGVAVDQIVAAARVNKRMVYHYFGSKDALFRAALHEVYARLEAVEFHAVERGRSPREKLTRLIESYFEFLDDEPEFTRLLLWENVQQGKHIEKQRQTLTKNPFLQRFRQIFEEGIASGQFNPHVDVSYLLIHVIGITFIYHSNRYSLSQGIGIDLGDPKIKAHGLDQALNLVFEGITAKSRAEIASLGRPEADSGSAAISV